MKTYRLEYKSSTGQFHLDNRTHEADTYGWVTIKEHITNGESKLFFDFIEYGFPAKIKKYTNGQVIYKMQLFEKILNFKNENNFRNSN